MRYTEVTHLYELLGTIHTTTGAVPGSFNGATHSAAGYSANTSFIAGSKVRYLTAASTALQDLQLSCRPWHRLSI